MTPLFSKLPDIWKDLDIRVSTLINGQGFLERFLNVPDAAFLKVENLILEFLRVHNIQEARDRFVSLHSEFLGHRWKDSKSRQWNRNRTQISIPRYSYKGSSQSILDLAKEYGSSYSYIVDMASTVMVESKQGSYDCGDCFYFDADYYHPGIFVLYITDGIDLEGFLEDFQYIQPAGTKWYFNILLSGVDTSLEIINDSNLIVYLDSGYNSVGTVLHDDNSNFIEYFDWVAQPAVDCYPIVISMSMGAWAVANAWFTVDSLTFKVTEEDVTVADYWLSARVNSEQPAVEPEIVEI